MPAVTRRGRAVGRERAWAARVLPLCLPAFVMLFPALAAKPARAADALPATELSIAPAREAARSHDAAQALLAQGRPDEALATIERGLQQVPGDLRLQFQRGVVLARLGRTDDAIAAFVELTQRFPELPEPYNNLATLYAQQGDLDRAEQALQEALRAMPAYSLAHENLGDLQLRLAERSYRRAVQADGGNVSARERLARVQTLITELPSQHR